MTCRIDLGSSDGAPDVADRRDPVSRDRDVAGEGIATAAVVDRPAANHDVVFLRRPARREEQQYDDRGLAEMAHVYLPSLREPLKAPSAPFAR